MGNYVPQLGPTHTCLHVSFGIGRQLAIYHLPRSFHPLGSFSESYLSVVPAACPGRVDRMPMSDRWNGMHPAAW